MPLWLASRVARSPPQPDLSEAAPAEARYHNPLLQCQGDAFMRNGIPVPGAGHMIHNTIKGLPEAMGHYQKFFDDLKVIERAITHRGRSERIVAKCMLGTPFSSQKAVITSFSFSLYTDRWGCVAAFAAAALVPVALLRRCWSQSAYEERGAGLLMERQWGGDDAGGKFEPKDLTRILRSPLFRNYHRMVVKLKAVPVRLQVWFDRCPCHEWILASEQTPRMKRKALKLDGLASGYCPCSTCRAWEVIDGKVDRVVRDLGESFELDIRHAFEVTSADGLSDPLGPDDIAVVLMDFNGGVSHIQLGFGIRLAWTKNLPFMLMALPHPDASRGVHWAKQCIKAYDAKPADQHHRKTLLFLRPGSPLRAAIDIFVDSGQMPDLLALNVAPFLFIPLGDRLIEREHKYLGDIARPKTPIQAGHAFSIRRLRDIEGLMAESAEFQEALLDRYLEVRTCKGAIMAMGLNHHPLFLDVLNPRGQPWRQKVTAIVWNFVEQLVYRRELGQKHESFPLAKKWAEVDDAKRKRTSRPQKPSTSLPSSVEDLLLKNARGHLVERGSAFGAIVVPERVDGNIHLEVRSLQQAMYRDEALALDALDAHSFHGVHPFEEGPSMHAIVYLMCRLCLFVCFLVRRLFARSPGIGRGRGGDCRSTG